MQQEMITQKMIKAEYRPRYQEVAVDHTAVSDMKYKQMNRTVLTEFLSYSSLKRSKGNTHLFHFLRLWARAATRPGYKDGIAYTSFGLQKAQESSLPGIGCANTGRCSAPLKRNAEDEGSDL